MYERIFFFIVLIMSAIIHEYAHGWTAERLGDPTAKLAGRLTLNPIPHIDLTGTIVVPLLLLFSGTGFIFGWAKPVPFNPYLLKDKKWGPALVAIAGPLSNLSIAVVISLLIRFLGIGSFTAFLSIIVFINVLLAVFNLVPIPPLDGSKILYALMPNTQKWLQIKMNLERYGMILVIFFIFFAWQLISPVIWFLFKFLVSTKAALLLGF